MLFLFLLVLPAAAQQDGAWRKMEASKRQVTDALIREAQAITARAAAEIQDRESWEKARDRRLLEMRDMLGLLPWPERTPLNVQITGLEEKPGYTIEKIAFQSLPRLYVTANLYIPKQRAGPVPGIVYVCGHSGTPLAGSKASYQRHGISLAKNGYAAIVLDAIQLAETFGLHHGVMNNGMTDWYARGYSPAGVEVWNAMRAIDYLETRPEVDATRIGMTGRSGGAAMTWFTAAVDSRVKVAVPVMGISTHAADLADNTQTRHCDCMYAINAFAQDMLHRGALIAPRPLLMAHGKEDALFPVPGYKEFEERVGALYGSYGRAGDFRNIEVDSGHKDSDYLREQAIRWFDRHLLNQTDRKLDIDYSEAPEEQLSVFGGNPPEDALNYRIHEQFTTPAERPRAGSAVAWRERSRELRKLLEGKVFATFGRSGQPLELQQTPRPDTPRTSDFRFLSEEGVWIHGYRKAPTKAEGKLPALLYIASEGETEREIERFLATVNRRDKAVRHVVYPRGVGEVSWDATFRMDTFRNAMLVGRTIDSMRLWDVLRGVEAVRQDKAADPDRILVAGRGISGALGLYAAILDPGVSQVLMMDPPASHVEGPIFLNVLRYTDLPEVAVLLAPRRITFFGRMPTAYQETKELFRAAGYPGNVFVSMDVAAVLEGRYRHDFMSGI